MYSYSKVSDIYIYINSHFFLHKINENLTRTDTLFCFILFYYFYFYFYLCLRKLRILHASSY